MCRHFTLIPYDDVDTRFLTYLLSTGLRYASSDNNTHGTGISYDDGKVNKSGNTAYDHTLADDWYETLNTIKFNLPVIGHVRRASVKIHNGKYPDKDAHPFKIGDIVLTHNGTISNFQDVVTDNKLTAGKIDSFAIAELVSKLPYPYTAESLNSVTSQLEGSFALIIQNVQEPDVLWVCRHSKPLYLVDVEGMTGIVATDMSVVDLALLDTNNASRTLLGVPAWDVYTNTLIEENKWYKVTKEKAKIIGDMTFKPTVKAVTTPYVPPAARGKSRTNSVLNTTFAIVDEYTHMIDVTLDISPTDFKVLYNKLLGNPAITPIVSKKVGHVIAFVSDVMLSCNENIKMLEELLEKGIKEEKPGYFVVQYND